MYLLITFKKKNAAPTLTTYNKDFTIIFDFASTFLQRLPINDWLMFRETNVNLYPD